MDPNVIKQQLEAALDDTQVFIQGDGQHFNAIIVSPIFEGLSLIARQRKVYDVLSDKIASGELHALSMKTHTPTEWEEKNNG